MSHKLIYRQSREEFRSETRRSKQLLEDLIGTGVVGYRAASFSIVKSSLWALDELIDAGFRYDSSVFPVHHDNYGIPDAPLEPYQIAAPSGRTLIEFPMAASIRNLYGFRPSGCGARPLLDERSMFAMASSLA